MMKPGSQVRAITLVVTLLTCLAFAGWALSKQEPCEAPDKWFAEGGPKSPDPNQDFPSSCAFHQWAWQSFLWLTQPEGDALRFMHFATPDKMFERNPGRF